MVSKEELKTLLSSPETHRIEKTVSTNDSEKFGEAICAFSNDLPGSRLPGYLLVGVHDDGRLSGMKADDRLIQTLLAFRTDGRIVPPPVMHIEVFSFEEGDVAVLEVAPHNFTPVRFKGRACIRTGARKGHANEAEERVLTERRTSLARTFDTMPCRGGSLADISLELFQIRYLPAAIDAETLAENHRDLRQQLASMKFFDLNHDCPTHAGILMFGNNPRYFIPGARVQYVRFEGSDEASDMSHEHSFDGDLTTQLAQMDEFIRANVVRKHQPELAGPYLYNYPVAAIRELLYNAVMHRDYESNAPIKFYQFTDRIEISNAGGLYGKARPENFPNENDYRNPAIAEAMKNLGFVNGFNIGVKRAQDALSRNGNSPARFITDQPASFSVIIPRTP